MENVDELTVLKGAAATALYGSRAANGAVIIKTKSGKAGQPLRFNFSTRTAVRHADPRRLHHRLGGGQIAATTATART